MFLTQFDSTFKGANITIIDETSGGVAPTFVQSTFGSANGNITLTLASAPTVGNTLVLQAVGTNSISTPAGWTQVVSGYLFTKTVAAGDTTTWPFICYGGSYPGGLLLVEVAGTPVNVRLSSLPFTMPTNQMTGYFINQPNTVSFLSFTHQILTCSSVTGPATIMHTGIGGFSYSAEVMRLTGTGTVTGNYNSTPSNSTGYLTCSMLVIDCSPNINSAVINSSGTYSVLTNRSLGALAYFEVATSATSGAQRVGIASRALTLTSVLGTDSNGVGYDQNGGVYLNNASIGTLATWSAGANIGVAVNPMLQKIWFRVNGGNWNNDAIGNQNPAANIGGISYSAMGAVTVLPAIGCNGYCQCYLYSTATNCIYTPPSGYNRLDSVNPKTFVSISTAETANNWSMPTWVMVNRSNSAVSNKWTIPPATITTRTKSFRYKTYQMGTANTKGGVNTSVTGVVQENGTPVAGKMVAIYDAKTMQLLGTYTTDASTGAFSIPALGRATVFAVAIDSGYQAQIFDNLTPQ